MNATESLKGYLSKSFKRCLSKAKYSTWAFLCPIQLLNSLIQTYLFYFWTVYADHLRFISLFLPCETESQWFSRTWRQYSLPLAYNLPLPLVCNFGHTWLLTEGSRTKKYIFEPTLPDTTFESAVFPPILFTTVTGKEQGFLGLGLNDTHEKNRREACRNWVISWLEIFRAVPALNDAVSRLLPSDLERSTGDRSRCCRCSRCGGLSTCTWVTPRKGCLHHQRGCYSVQPPIQVLIWKLVLQSGRSWLMGDPLLPSGNRVLSSSTAGHQTPVVWPMRGMHPQRMCWVLTVSSFSEGRVAAARFSHP